MLLFSCKTTSLKRTVHKKMATVNIHCMKKITSFVFHTIKKIIFLVTYSFNCSKNDTWPPVAYIFYILRQLDGQLDKSMCPENKQRGRADRLHPITESLRTACGAETGLP